MVQRERNQGPGGRLIKERWHQVATRARHRKLVSKLPVTLR